MERDAPKAHGACCKIAVTFKTPSMSASIACFVSQRIPVISFRPAKSIFHGELARCSYLMQNLAEEFGQFRPGPSREELNHMLNLPQ